MCLCIHKHTHMWKMSIEVHVYNPSTQKAETERAVVEDRPLLYSKFEASPRYLRLSQKEEVRREVRERRDWEGGEGEQTTEDLLPLPLKLFCLLFAAELNPRSSRGVGTFALADM